MDPQIAKLIEEQKHSGMSIAAFAREHGLPPWKLYQAGRRRSKRRSGFVEVAVVPKASVPAPLEVLLPGDLRVRIPSDFDESSLRRLVGVLASC